MLRFEDYAEYEENEECILNDVFLEVTVGLHDLDLCRFRFRNFD